MRQRYVAIGLSIAFLGAFLAAIGSGRATVSARASTRSAGDADSEMTRAVAPPRNDTRLREPTPQSDLEWDAAVAALVSDVATRMTEHHSYSEYQRTCEGKRLDSEALAAQCRSMYSDIAGYGAFLAQLTRRISLGLPSVQALIARDGKDSVRAKFWRAAGESSDPLIRIVSLMVLTHDKDLRVEGAPPPVDGNPYKDLLNRPGLEAKLLAEFHRPWPVSTDKAASEFRTLATSPYSDLRNRRAALVALGHPETAEELLDVVQSLDDLTNHWADVAQALALCGLDCISGFEEFVRTGGRPARMAAYEALQSAPDDDVAALREMILRYVPADIDAAEQEAVDVERQIQAGLLK